MSETQTAKKRDLPLWLGILVISIGVLGAGWFVWSQVSGFWSGPSGVFTIEGVDPGAVRPMPRRQTQGAAQMRPAANVREMSKTEWRVRTAAFTLDVKKVDANLNMVLSASSMRVLPADAQWVVVSRSRLTPEAGAQLGLSAEQIRQFKALPTNIRHELALSTTQQQELQTVFQKYLDTPEPQKPALGQEISVTLNQVGQAALPALTQSLQSQYEAYKKSVTPDQWTKLKQLASTAPPAATP